MARPESISAASKQDTQATTITAYKGFNKDLTCRGFQYETGKTYEHNGPVVRCGEGGFHSCEMPLDVLTYYPPCTSRYGEVMAAGDIARAGIGDDSKIASAKITVSVDISLGDLTRKAVAWVAPMAKKHGNGNSTAGYNAHASTAGDNAHASTAGNYSHASTAGYNAHASTAGDNAHASTAGDNAHASGVNGKAMAHEGGAISLAAYDDARKLVAVRSSLVGENGIEAGKRYRLSVDGEFQEVEA